MGRNLHPAWRSDLGLIFATMLWAIFAAFGLASGGPGLMIIGVLGLVILVLALIYRHYVHRYYIDSDRIEHRKGIIARDVKSVRLGDLRNVNLRQGIIDRLLGIGTVEFSSAGGSGIEVQWVGVLAPSKLKAEIEQLRDGS